MASPPCSTDPLTLQVSNLAQATTFYLAALQPLGYAFISKVQHQTPVASSDAVGLGPAGTSRVDVFLSQATQNSAGAASGGAHVVFPAASNIEVRDFYAAALRAGGKAVARPDHLSSSGGKFSTIVADQDDNQVEVCFGDDPTHEAPANEAAGSAAASSDSNGSIRRWREGVAESTTGGKTASSKATKAAPPPAASAAPTRPSKTERSTGKSAANVDPVKTETGTRRPSSQTSSKRSSKSVKSNSTRRSGTPAGNRRSIGTIIGVAAGAALAYTMTKSKDDSVREQEDHERRMRGFDAKDEARAHFAAADRRRRRQSSGKAERIDRDSGYGSTSHYSASPPNSGNRSATFPTPTYEPPSSRGRSSIKKSFDYGHSDLGPESERRAPPARRQSVGGSSASQSTAKPVRRSQSNASKRSSWDRPTSPPGPPSMPDPPPTRSRRTSISIQKSGLGRQSSVRDNKPPSAFPRAMGTEASRPEEPSVDRTSSSRQSTTAARGSEAPQASTARPSSSHRSNTTARPDTKPGSDSRTQTTVKPAESRRSSVATPKASKPPAPPSEGRSNLTARALSSKDEPPATGNKLNDLATVIPDDSISCASSRDDRRERDSRRLSRTDSRRSRRSSRRER